MVTGAWGAVVLVAGLWAQAAVVPPNQTEVEVVRSRIGGRAYEPTAPVRIEFRNDFPNGFRVSELEILLDGEPIAQVMTGPNGEVRNGPPVYEAAIPAGLHRLAVRALLVGRNRGLFSYMDGYRLRLVANQAFSPKPETLGVITIALAERKGFFVPFERQAYLTFGGDAGLVGAASTPIAGPRTPVLGR